MAKKIEKETVRHDDFYEVMPSAYMDSYSMFDIAEEAHDDVQPEVRQRMVRQLLVLVGLLVLQFVLFAVLLQSTINLQ